MPKNPDPKYTYSTRKLKDIKRIVLHCSDTEASLQAIAKYDVTPSPTHHISTKGCPGFTYHYFIEKNGMINWCMDHTVTTWHVGDFNGSSLGVCLQYKASGSTIPPTPAQMASVIDLMMYLCLSLGLDPDNIGGHRELCGTGYTIVNAKKKLRKECPGLLVNLDALRSDVAKAVQEQLKIGGFYSGPVDGIFGPNSEKALAEYKKVHP